MHDPTTPSSSSPAWRDPFLLGVCALCVFSVWNAMYFLPYTVDDTYITLRYAWNLVEGQGLVFNPGERVEGYSNPSWTLLAALGLAAGLDGTVFVKWVGIACTGALPLAAWWAARRLGLSRGFALLPALVAATDLNVAYWAPEGLETPLWTLLLTVWIGGVAGRWTGDGRELGSAVVGAALYLTRPEAPLFIAPVVLLEAWRAWKEPARRAAAVRWAVVLAVPCLAWLGFRAAYYGDWVANTYYVKATHEFRLAPLQSYTESWAAVASPVHAVLLIVALPLAAFPGSGLGMIALAALGVQLVFLAKAGGDWMPQNRFWAPAVPIVALVVASGAQAAGELVKRAIGARGPRVALASVGVLLAAQAWIHLTHDSLYVRDGKPLVVKRYEQGAKTWTERLAMPWWGGVPDRVLKILEYIPDDATIAYSEIGLLGFVTENRVIDGLALVDRRLSGATGEKMATVVESWSEQPPDYLIVRGGVPILLQARKSDWYRVDGYRTRARWHNTDVDAKGEGELPKLPVAQRLERLERAVLRVPRELSFHRARLAAAKELGDAAEIERACGDLVAAFPHLAAECGGGASVNGASGASVATVAAPDAPYLAQTTNASFERLTNGKPDDWTTLPADAPGWQVVDGAARTGARAIEVSAATLVCTPWKPVLGPIRVKGAVRTDKVVAGANTNQSAAAQLRLKSATGQQRFPLLQTWQGDQPWTPFDLVWSDVADTAEFRACVGLTGGTGTAWFDDVEAGSGPPPGVADVDIPGDFEALAPWDASPPTGAAIDPAGSSGAAVRVDAGAAVCAPWRKAPRAIRVTGTVRTNGATAGAKPWEAPAVFVRSRGPADANQPMDVSTVFSETPDWTPFEASWSPAAGRDEYRLCLGFTGGSGTLWLDDVTITEVP